ncbi:MAG: class I SAM-dependent methyltransferase [Turicibacter sp.]
MRDNLPIAKLAFEKLADDYVEFVDSKPHNAYYERPAMIKLLDSVELKNRCVVDAGCAAGWYSQQLLNKGANVKAFDISEKMVEHALQRTNNQIDARVWNLETPLTFIEPLSVDVVLSSLTLHYIKDWSVPIAEFNRILKPSGVIILSVQHPMEDYKISKNQIYYEKELVEYTWNGMPIAGSVNVPFYRRSFSEMLNTFSTHQFELLEVVEPRPLIEMADINLKSYESLKKKPAFICFKLAKK